MSWCRKADSKKYSIEFSHLIIEGKGTKALDELYANAEKDDCLDQIFYMPEEQGRSPFHLAC